MDQQIKKIHNAVFVSDRIITYKVAAAILEVEVNEAKKVLDKYVNDQKNKDEILNVSYILGGVTHEEIHKVKLVPQIKYEKTKSTFKTINIDHIYSIQKSPLADWSSIANVDDFLYDKNNTPPQTRDVKPKTEPVVVKKEVKSPQKINKKGALSNFLNNTNQKKTENKVSPAPKTVESAKSKKQEKNNAFTNYFSKGNKENVKEIKNESKESDDDEEIFKVNKKRSRVLIDEEDDNNPSKCAKVDILDDPEDVKEEYQSDEDLFGSPEKDEELMKDTESTEMETENSVPEPSSENHTETTENHTDTTEENTETTEENTETTEENTEKSETMYEDEDGYFVTEKKKPGPKRNSIKQEKQLSKKEVEAKKKIEKEETKSKKEVTQKIKNSTNQKTLFSFFQKK